MCMILDLEGLGPVDDSVRRFGVGALGVGDVFDSPSQYARQHPHAPDLQPGAGGPAAVLNISGAYGIDHDVCTS